MSRTKTKHSLEHGLSIGATAEVTGVEIHTLRYWEREFAGYLEPARTEGGQRRYLASDIQAVMTLSRLLRDEMFSVAGAKRYLQNCRKAS